MNRLRLLLVFLFLALTALGANAQDARSAVVRITSHGCSGTVIETAADHTLILSCAHAFRGADAQKPIVLDVPWPSPQPASPRKAKLKLRALDTGMDLTLIEVSDGPYPFVAPVAAPAFRPGRNVWSVGY